MKMYMRFKDGKKKALTLSYDDGVVQDIRLIGILNQYGLKATFNIGTGRYEAEDTIREKYYGKMKRSEATELYIGSGHEVAVHAYNHPYLEQLKQQEILTEIWEDRKDIEKTYGTIVRGMAYPYGTYSEAVKEVLKICGIVYARTTHSTHKFGIPEDWLELHPTCHHKDAKLMELCDRFLNNGDKLPQLFYLWGHSYEFDDRDNWNVLEECGQKMGGREDIWYATNIEIYDYVKAYEQLIVSADRSRIYNPTATDIWVYDNKETFCIRSGETVTR